MGVVTELSYVLWTVRTASLFIVWCFGGGTF